MTTIQEFNDGDWIFTEDGICQVLGSQKYHIEPFFKDEYDNLGIGDVFDNKVVYKIFCNFDGKPRKTKFINWNGSEYCHLLNNKYKKLRDKVIKENPDIYNKFITRKLDKPLYSRVEFSIRVEPTKRKEIKEKINTLYSSFNRSHDFATTEELIYKNIDGIISDKLVKNDVLQTNLLLSLFYDVLKTENNKFAFVGIRAVETYCAEDEQ